MLGCHSQLTLLRCRIRVERLRILILNQLLIEIFEHFGLVDPVWVRVVVFNPILPIRLLELAGVASVEIHLRPIFLRYCLFLIICRMIGV